MTWTLNAAGHTNAAEGSADWSEIEQKLHDELAAALAPVLAKPEYGCVSSRFNGNYVSGDSLHVPQDDPGFVHEHQDDAPGSGVLAEPGSDTGL